MRRDHLLALVGWDQIEPISDAPKGIEAHEYREPTRLESQPCGHRSQQQVACPFRQSRPLTAGSPPIRDHGVATTRRGARCITNRDTMPTVATAISVRLDDEALRALSLLESTGLSRSAAIRAALVAAAARLRDRPSLAAEVAALEADREDRAEMAAVSELMEQLRA